MTKQMTIVVIGSLRVNIRVQLTGRWKGNTFKGDNPVRNVFVSLLKRRLLYRTASFGINLTEISNPISNSVTSKNMFADRNSFL